MQNVIDPRQLGLTRAITTQAVTTEVLSDPINMEGWDSLIVIVNGGTNAATSGTATVVIKESATSGGTYTAVSGTTMSYAITDDDIRKVGVMESSALTAGTFVKISVTGGTGGSLTCGVECILCNAKDTSFYTAALASPASGDVVALTYDVS